MRHCRCRVVPARFCISRNRVGDSGASSSSGRVAVRFGQRRGGPPASAQPSSSTGDSNHEQQLAEGELQVRRSELGRYCRARGLRSHTRLPATAPSEHTAPCRKCSWEWIYIVQLRGAPLSGSERQRHSGGATQRAVLREDSLRTKSVDPTLEALAGAQVELEAHNG